MNTQACIITSCMQLKRKSIAINMIIQLICPWNKQLDPLETLQPLQIPLSHYKTPAQPKQRVCAHPYIMCLSEMCVLRLTWQTRLTGPIISLIFTARESTLELRRPEAKHRKEADKTKPWLSLFFLPKLDRKLPVTQRYSVESHCEIVTGYNKAMLWDHMQSNRFVICKICELRHF